MSFEARPGMSEFLFFSPYLDDSFCLFILLSPLSLVTFISYVFVLRILQFQNPIDCRMAEAVKPRKPKPRERERQSQPPDVPVPPLPERSSSVGPSAVPIVPPRPPSLLSRALPDAPTHNPAAVSAVPRQSSQQIIQP